MQGVRRWQSASIGGSVPHCVRIAVAKLKHSANESDKSLCGGDIKRRQGGKRKKAQSD